jgi:hypothetical protein
MTAWQYLIIALPRFEAPTTGKEPSAALQVLNAEGERGWEAVDGACRRKRGRLAEEALGS